jgi:phosphomannomutase
MEPNTTRDQRLGDCLRHEPRELKFGTSGRRGLVADLTQLELYINARAELRYLQSLPLAEGGIARGDEFFFAYDLRPSSTRFDSSSQGRGEIAQAIERAIGDAGMVPINLGSLPTPALTYYAIRHSKGSMMVTGSHIPFDRNGYKTNTSRGELLKHHEGPVTEVVQALRKEVCEQRAADSLFNDQGMFKSGHRELPEENGAAKQAFLARYLNFWPDAPLRGTRLLFYQHSAVGRDLVPQLLEQLGAEVFPMGRSEEFIPIDTENIDAAQLATIQALADEAIRLHGRIDAVVSTDGDSDRPLVLSVDAQTRRVSFHSGDLLGMAVAEYLGADAVVVPISCNDAIDRSSLASVLEPKTRIGSPYVIAGMESAVKRGKRIVCGWEANGGFLIGSDIQRNGRNLEVLPTRDAVLPILGVLVSAKEKNLTLNELFGQMPKRFSCAALMKNLPKAIGARIVSLLSPGNNEISEVQFGPGRTVVFSRHGQEIQFADHTELEIIRDRIASYFSPARGFSEITRLNYVDGVRISFETGEVAHLRPSGNADEFRVYAVADNAARSAAITAACLAPNGILLALEREAPSQQAG